MKTIRVVCALPLLVLAFALFVGAPRGLPDAAADAASHVVAGNAYRGLAALQEAYPGRWIGTEAHGESPAFIAEALRAAGAVDVRVDLLPSHSAGAPEMRNVLARVAGVDTSRAIVLGAHHDTVGGAPGAIDDGGAIAAIIEVARVLASGAPPACDIEIAIFDGEESGLLGSKAYVDALGDVGRSRVRSAVAVELVGWTEDQLVVHTLPYGFAWESAGIVPAWLPETALAAGHRAGVSMHYGDPLLWLWYQPTVRMLGLGTGSDAGAFVERGVPACMLTGSSLTGFYSGYHTRRDAMALVSSERLDDATRVLAAMTVGLADQAASDYEPSRAFGDAYLLLGRRRIAQPWIALVALASLVAAWVAARRLRAENGAETAHLLLALAGATTLLAFLGNLSSVVCGVPLVIGCAFAVTLPRLRALVLLPAVIPLLVQAMVLVTASTAFGFRWRGGPVEGALLIVLAVSGIGAIVLVRLHAPPRVRDTSSTSSHAPA